MKEVADFVAQRLSAHRRASPRRAPTSCCAATRTTGSCSPTPSPTSVCRCMRRDAGPPRSRSRGSSRPARPRASGSSSTSPRRCTGVISLGRRRARLPHAVGRARSRHPRPRPRRHDVHRRNSGLLELRELVCADLDARYGTSLPARRRVPGHLGGLRGSRPGAARAAQPRRRGDRPRALLRRLPARAWPSPAASPCRWRCDPAQGYRLDADADRRGGHARGPRRCCSAHRPTPPAPPSRAADLAALAALAEREDLWLVSDEIYDRLTYTGTHTSTAAVPGAWDRTVVLNGFSKSYAMTGWRVGYVCAPAAAGGADAPHPPVHDALRPARQPGRRDRGAEAAPDPTSPRWSPTTTGAGGCSSRASTSWG